MRQVALKLKDIPLMPIILRQELACPHLNIRIIIIWILLNGCLKRRRSIEKTIAFYASAAAARKMRVIAHVKSAVELSQAQKDKLASSLSGKIGQPVRLNVELDPKVLGGLSIRFADELIDATIVNRLADAGRALAV